MRNLKKTDMACPACGKPIYEITDKGKTTLGCPDWRKHPNAKKVKP